MYLQFSLDHVHILSPSVAMETHLTQRGRDSPDDGSEKTGGMKEEKTGGQKRRRLEEPTGSPSALMSTCPSGGRACVSMVIRVEQKEGVSWRNAGVGVEAGRVGLVLCFSVRAAGMGPVVPWRQDPKNRPVSEEETGTETKVRTPNRPHLRCPIMHLSSCFLSPGGPAVLRNVSPLVPSNPAGILLQTGFHQLAGEFILVYSDLTSGQCGILTTADWFPCLSARIPLF